MRIIADEIYEKLIVEIVNSTKCWEYVYFALVNVTHSADDRYTEDEKPTHKMINQKINNDWKV